MMSDMPVLPDQPEKRNPSDVHTIDAGGDGFRDFILRKLNNDHFMRTGKQIIEACELHIGVEAWKQNMADLWSDITRFAGAHRGQVKRVYMLPRPGAVQVLYVTNKDEFDFDLADDLARWNIRIRRERLMYGEVEASQIPASELSQFVDDDALDDAIEA